MLQLIKFAVVLKRVSNIAHFRNRPFEVTKIDS